MIRGSVPFSLEFVSVECGLELSLGDIAARGLRTLPNGQSVAFYLCFGIARPDLSRARPPGEGVRRIDPLAPCWVPARLARSRPRRYRQCRCGRPHVRFGWIHGHTGLFGQTFSEGLYAPPSRCRGPDPGVRVINVLGVCPTFDVLSF